VLSDEAPKGSVSLTYRDQWNKISIGAYSTALLESDFSFYSSSIDNWSAGIILYNDVSNNGIYKINNATFTTSYTRKIQDGRINKTALSLGGGIGYSRTNINTSQLWFGRQYDQSIFAVNSEISNGEPSLVEDRNYMSIDFGFRLLNEFNSFSTEIALSATHLNNPSIGDFDTPETIGTRVTGIGNIGYKARRNLTHNLFVKAITQNKSFQITPAYVLDFDFNDYDDKSLKLGIGARMVNTIDGIGAESAILTFKIESRQWTGGIAYDINISDLNFHTRGGGAFELSLGYLISSGH